MNNDATTRVFQEFLQEEHLDRNAVLTGSSWWIDVGIQVSLDALDCLAWRTDSHSQIVQEICNIDVRNAVRLTSVGSSQYTCDMTSHLPQVSGCRIEPDVQGQGPFQVAYLQLYTTDKAVTYRLDQGHHSKFITCADRKANNFINGLYTTYRNAIDNNYGQARMEVRIPVAFCKDVLVELDRNVICLISIHGIVVCFVVNSFHL